jgi:hypothetical protein
VALNCGGDRGNCRVTGIKPKGTRHVARTNMMSVARVVLLIIAVIILYIAYTARNG